MHYLSLLLLLLTPFLAETKDIYVGMSSALTGPAGFLGREMKLGIESAFYESNSNGGINGNIIKLVAMDDKYEPFYTELNMKRFGSDDNFVAVIGNVGTPTAKVALPIAQEYNLPFIGALTGSNLLRSKPRIENVINYRASYSEEINKMIQALFKAGVSIDELAFFTQDDDYGDAGYLGLIKALNLFDVEINKIQSIPHGRYIRNTSYVEEGLKNIINSKRDIKAFIMIGTYEPVAKFIKLAKEHYPSAYFLNVSFVGAEALKNELCANNRLLCREYTKNVIITQTVPYLDSNVSVVQDYKLALEKYLAQNTQENANALQEFEKRPNAISLEGYIVGRMFLRAIAENKMTINRESLILSFNRLGDFDLGLGLNISDDNHQASSAIFPVSINNQKINQFSWESMVNREDIKNMWQEIKNK